MFVNDQEIHQYLYKICEIVYAMHVVCKPVAYRFHRIFDWDENVYRVKNASLHNGTENFESTPRKKFHLNLRNRFSTSFLWF